MALPAAIGAKLAYQEGLFFQRTVGNLEKALKSYDRALEAATKAEDPGLLESILLRRAECFKLLGKDNQQQTTIAALQKETRAEAARLGVARYFPPESDMIVLFFLSESERSSRIFAISSGLRRWPNKPRLKRRPRPPTQPNSLPSPRRNRPSSPPTPPSRPQPRPYHQHRCPRR